MLGQPTQTSLEITWLTDVWTRTKQWTAATTRLLPTLRKRRFGCRCSWCKWPRCECYSGTDKLNKVTPSNSFLVSPFKLLIESFSALYYGRCLPRWQEELPGMQSADGNAVPGIKLGHVGLQLVDRHTGQGVQIRWSAVDRHHHLSDWRLRILDLK